jgi:coenzyme F420-reducing hydrogenase delta subunit
MSDSRAASTQAISGQSGAATGQRAGAAVVVAFICENCGRPGLVPTSGVRRRPSTPDFNWPIAVNEVVVPCAGRLQPEHFLKAFEDGADAIGVVCCEEGNCHHLEGNRRCSRRLEHVNGLLDQIGLGANRLMIFHLPGSAAQDMALGASAGTAQDPPVDVTVNRKVAEVRDAFVARLSTISANPMRRGAVF